MIPQLRPYQAEAGRAVLESVLHRRGLTFTVEITRQGGKNELSAQLEVLLLTRHMLRGGTGVKASPTFSPQTLNSMLRLRERLNDAGYGGVWRPEHGHLIRLGRARFAFFSADKASNVVGATASILLEIDEAQDVDCDKFDRDFRPMGAATNVTTVLYGTTWDETTLLEEVKQRNLESERRDGIRRHFRYDWQEVARYNPEYGRYVESERERLGEQHPLFQTQYALQPLMGGGGLLNARQLALLDGTHPRQQTPVSSPSTLLRTGFDPALAQASRPFGEAQDRLRRQDERGRAPVGVRDEAVYVAGIDLAGEAEEGLREGALAIDDALLRQRRPRQDSTVVTIARLNYAGASDLLPEPWIEVVEQVWRTGVPHHTLLAELVALLREVWQCRRVAVDATGVGAGIAGFLERVLGPVVVQKFMFSAQSKSHLGFTFLAAVNAGRLKLYAADGSPEYQQCRRELARARSAFRANQTMNFFVDPAEGHDDFLMSLALTVEAAAKYLPQRPRLARGSIRTED